MKVFIDKGIYRNQLSLGANICYEEQTSFEYLEYKEIYITVSLFKIYFTIGIRTKPKMSYKVGD